MQTGRIYAGQVGGKALLASYGLDMFKPSEDELLVRATAINAANRLITLLRVMRYHPDELLRELEGLSHSRQEFHDAKNFIGWTDIQKSTRFLLTLETCFGGRMRGPTSGYGLTGKAKFNQSDAWSVITTARDRLDGVTI